MCKLLYAARIDNKPDTVNSDAGLGNVGTDDALARAFGRKIKDLYTRGAIGNVFNNLMSTKE